MRTRFWFSLALILPALSAPAQGYDTPLATAAGRSVAPENAEARTRLEELFYAPVEASELLEPRLVQQQSTGTRVRFQTRRQNGYLYYLFQNELDSQFEIAASGTYIIKRHMGDGRYAQIKVFYRNDPGCYVRIFPDRARSSMDVYLFGAAVDRGVVLSVEFQSLLTEPFARVVGLSAATVRWDRLLYRRSAPMDSLTRGYADQIRALLPSLSDREDGAMNEDRRYVSIETGESRGSEGGLNCSGFAKWITDGFYHARTGRYLAIEPLKEKHLELRGHRWSRRFEDERDPYFGLDWSRNLAASLWQAQGFPAADPEGFDVRHVDYLKYREDVGFPLEELKLLLFLETAANPGHFYIGSLNREYGAEPVLRQHFHMVVLFAYFTPAGELRIAVFDRNREVTIAGTIERYPGAHIHLVRLPLGQSFDPPQPSE